MIHTALVYAGIRNNDIIAPENIASGATSISLLSSGMGEVSSSDVSLWVRNQ